MLKPKKDKNPIPMRDLQVQAGKINKLEPHEWYNKFIRKEGQPILTREQHIDLLHNQAVERYENASDR